MKINLYRMNTRNAKNPVLTILPNIGNKDSSSKTGHNIIKYAVGDIFWICG